MKWLVNKSNSILFKFIYRAEIQLPTNTGRIRIKGKAYILGWGTFFVIQDLISNEIIWKPKTSGNVESIDFILEKKEDVILVFYGIDPGAGFTGEKILDLDIYTESDPEFHDTDPVPDPVEEKKKSKLKYNIIGTIFFILFLLILFFSLLSCSTNKKSIEKERIVTVYDTFLKRDSIFITKDKVILLPTVNTEVISNPCDSTGNLKIIEKVIRIPYIGNVVVKSDGNNLVAKVNTDSIISVVEKEYNSHNENQFHQISTQSKETSILKVVPFNWWMVGCIASLVVNGILIFLYVKNKFI